MSTTKTEPRTTPASFHDNPFDPDASITVNLSDDNPATVSLPSLNPTTAKPRIIGVTELVLRDAHQSLLAARMGIEDMVDTCEDIDKAGYWSVECWGGATFDACIRFLNEDPWERLRTFRKLMPHSRLQMLLRGQNLLGYRHYDDMVVDKFVEKSAENGMDVFRVFDGLNDPRNIDQAMKAVKKVGKHAQGTICYTISPVHTVEGYLHLAGQLLDMGADSIAIKDMAALLRPQPAHDIIRAIKETYGNNTQINVHCHSTTGVTMATLYAAIRAGADVVDTAISSMSLGPGHNPTGSLVHMLEGTGYRTDLNMECLGRVREHFARVRPKYSQYETRVLVESDIFRTQIPGGMLSTMELQLKEQGAAHRRNEVMAEVASVRADAGFPPLVTPMSQIVGTQAIFNVLLGRYEKLTTEFADLVLGYYGRTPGDINPDLIVQAQEQTSKTPLCGRPADHLAPEWEDLVRTTKELEGSNATTQDVLTYAMFPDIASKFFTTRTQGPINVGKTQAQLVAEKESRLSGDLTPVAPITYNVIMGGRRLAVKVERA
ncbi:MAG: methylmalonyl-CoA carboxytransferase subunit 5S [Propionibacteriaceae bacterium]|nr:methylmalonyl-CoA carboxytransferase subunit 5S [Propionibacteriaceae bacterium]